jgi:hypothetical protein
MLMAGSLNALTAERYDEVEGAAGFDSPFESDCEADFESGFVSDLFVSDVLSPFDSDVPLLSAFAPVSDPLSDLPARA